MRAYLAPLMTSSNLPRLYSGQICRLRALEDAPRHRRRLVDRAIRDVGTPRVEGIARSLIAVIHLARRASIRR